MPLLELKSSYLYSLLVVPLAAQLLDRMLHPLDNILSVQQRFALSLPASYMRIKQSSGMRGFFAGFSRPLITFGPSRVIMTSLYYNMNAYLTGTNYNPTVAAIICGLCAGVVDATLTTPAENHRVRSVFKVPPASNLRQQFIGYEAVLLRSLFGATIILSGTDLVMNSAILPPQLQSHFYVGFAMGICSQFFTSPFDVWKNAVMSNPDVPSIDHLRTIIKERGFYRGLGTKMLRMGVGSSIVVGTINSLL